MSILVGRQLDRYYGAQDVFRGLDCVLARHDKTGLVGANGSGKTTLLRILLGIDPPDGGNVHRARGLRVGYLPQKPVLDGSRTLMAEMEQVFNELIRQQAVLHDLADAMAVAEDPTDLLAQYAEAEQRFDAEGGYSYDARIKQVLGGLGFGPQTYDWPVSHLSGGQVTRALLARLLLEDPELLVLDEPTNYLDLQALEWLESYLASWSGSLLVVSHDRFFLDKVVNHIWEIERGRLTVYNGNYSAYLLQRTEARERQLREYRAQQEMIERTEEYIRRNKAGQLAKQARGRETRLARVERIEAPTQEARVGLRLSTRIRSGDRVLMSDGIVVGYQDEDGSTSRLFSSGPFLVQRGWRIALLGPNGAGKTTLLRTLLGQLEPLDGHFCLGASVKIGYLPQSQAWLDLPTPLLDYVLEQSDLLYGGARSLLGRFLFTEEDMTKPLSALSGGERSRLALAQLTLEGANLLILDEPTTHLDLTSQEVLQQVLMGFAGTILFVSHDRYLVNALASHIWWLEQGSMIQFEGGYDAFMAYRAREERPAARGEGTESAGPRDDRLEAKRLERRLERSARDQSVRIAALESRITELERSLEEHNAAITRAGEAQDVARVQQLGSVYQALQAELADTLEEWETAAGELL